MWLAIQNFLSLTASYNSAIFPVQLVFLVLGILAVYFLFKHKLEKNFLIGGLLSLLWIWMVIIYHILYFPPMQVGAYFFGVFFVAQGILFFKETFQEKNLIFDLKKDLKSFTAVFFILYGLIMHPVISFILNGTVSVILDLGLSAPTIILTFGFLMLTDKRFSRYLMIIPSFCAIIGTAGAFYSGMYQDVILLFASIAANIYLIPKRRFREVNTFSYY